MRLRTRIQAPERFEDEDYNTLAASDATKPAFPRLLREQTVSFDPRLPPAAFPSLTHARPSGDGDCRSDDLSEPADINMPDTDRSSDPIFLPIVRHGEHPSKQSVSADGSRGTHDPGVCGTSFLDDVQTTDEEEQEVSLQSTVPIPLRHSNHGVFLQTRRHCVEGTRTDGAHSICWTQLAHPLQVEIFENLCSSCYGHSADDILGLNRNELCDVMEHLWNRNKQIVAEDRGIQELQETQLRAILRKDHSSSLSTDGWRDHVASTRMHLPHISARPDYFICSKAEFELARRFLNERGIDTRVLGQWALNKPNNGANSRAQTRALQVTESMDGVDSGYNSEIPKLGTDHATETRGEFRQPNALLEIPNSADGCLAGSSFQAHKRSQSTRDGGPDPDSSQNHGAGPSTAVVTSTAPIGLQIPGSAMSLRAPGSHQTPRFKMAMAAMMKTKGGEFEGSDASCEDEDERIPVRSPPRLSVNPLNSPRDTEDLDPGNGVISPGQRAITLKISPKRLETVQALERMNTRLSHIGPYQALTPPTGASTKAPRSDLSKHNRSRSQQPMPVARQLLTEQDQERSNAFSRKLLETQRGARLYTPPASLGLAPQQFQSQTSTSPKRLKLDLPLETTGDLPGDDVPLQTVDSSSHMQRKSSASSQEAPPWSPITQVSNSSRPPSRREFYHDDFQPHKALSANISMPLFHPAFTNEIQSIVSTASRPLPRNKASYRRPSIAENGSPVLGLTFDVRNSSTILPDGRPHQQAKPEARPGRVLGTWQAAEPPQTLARIPSNLAISSRWSVLGAPASSDPLRTRATDLLQDQHIGLQSAAPGRLAETLITAVSTTPSSAKKLGVRPPNVIPAEQCKLDAILSRSAKKPQTVGWKPDVQMPEPTPTSTPAPSDKHAEEDEPPSRGRSLPLMKATDTLLAAGMELHQSPQARTGKDGKVRPRTYVKSQKQMQKEAANAAAKAALGKGGVSGKKRTTEGQKADTKADMAPQTAMRESPASQPVVHVETPLEEGARVDQKGPCITTQIAAEPESHDVMDERLVVEDTPIELPAVVTPSNQSPLAVGDSKAAQRTDGIETGESSKQDRIFEATTVGFRKIATPKGKKVAVNRAKAAVQGYQTEMAMRAKSALTDEASPKEAAVSASRIDDQDQYVLPSMATPKPGNVGTQMQNGQTPAKTATPEAEIDMTRVPPSSNETVTPGTDVPSSDSAQAAPGKRRNQKQQQSSGQPEPSRVPRADAEGRTKAFRGNQYLNADRTPRRKTDGARPVA